MLGILDYLSVAMTSPTFSAAPSSMGYSVCLQRLRRLL